MATILFVDDDEVERIFAREVLEPRGHRILFAGDGEGALEIFQRPDLAIDVVVTDLAMPKLNGLRLIKALKELDPWVRIIAASGVSADQLDLAEEFGAVRTLGKPWTPPAFVAALDDVLSEGSAKADDPYGGTRWEEMMHFEDHREIAEPAGDLAWPPLIDLMGLWVGDEHFFPSPSVTRGLIAEGRIEFRAALGDEALLLERECSLDSEVRERKLSLLSWTDSGRRVTRHDFEGGTAAPQVFEGRWTGAILELEGRGPAGTLREEHWWRNETLTIRSWIVPDVPGAESILAFEGTYQRVRSFGG